MTGDTAVTGTDGFRTGLFRRPVRSCYRSQLSLVCRWIYEESCPLDMHQVTSRPPSKPIAPLKGLLRLVVRQCSPRAVACSWFDWLTTNGWMFMVRHCSPRAAGADTLTQMVLSAARFKQADRCPTASIQLPVSVVRAG